MFFIDNGAFSFTYAVPSSSGMPFSEIRNIASASPSRLQPASGSENADPQSSPKASWCDVSDEDKVLSDMGIEDPEQEEELEVFKSIPGFDDAWEDEEPDTVIARLPRSQGVLEDERIEDYATDNSAYAADSEDLCGTSEDDESEDDGDGDSSDPPSVASDVGFAQDVDEDGGSSESSTASSDSELSESDEESAAEDDDANDILGGSEPSQGDDADSSTSSVVSEVLLSVRAVHHTQASPARAVRRSMRIAAAKRDRDEDTGDWTVQSSRPVKRVRPNRRVASAQAESSPVRQPTGTRAQQQGNQRAQRTERKELTTKTPAVQPGKSRSGRIPISFLKSCVATQHTKVSCSVKGCTTVLDIMQPFATRKHLRAHHQTQLKVAKIRCAWEGCGETISNGGNACGLLRHYDEAHLKLRYHCPGKCVDGNGQMRTWCRSDELTRHEQRNPCDYLKRHPIPRSTRHVGVPSDVDEG
ncbi:hypothetical protein C8Q70DRAFT_142031 [Cubamyces menziesii]|nr:hypothetical protein C8Q70DRAFT_142031 [Cubamyces menziesii]